MTQAPARESVPEKKVLATMTPGTAKMLAPRAVKEAKFVAREISKGGRRYGFRFAELQQIGELIRIEFFGVALDDPNAHWSLWVQELDREKNSFDEQDCEERA